MAPGSRCAFSFGPYELRARTRELYKFGVKLKLRPQPFQILEILLERPGDVVSRDELRETLWKDGTFVDYEHGLNTAIRELRAVLSDSATEPQFIETIPRVGYRLIVPVECKELETPSAASNTPPAPARAETELSKVGGALTNALPAPAPVQGRRHILWLAILAASLASVAGFIVLRHRNSPAPPAPQLVRKTIAVLPFENLTGDPAQDYFADGLTEEMIFQVGALDPAHLGVIARTSVMRYKNSSESTAAIGRDLGAEYLLESSVRRNASRVRVSTQLIRVSDQTNLWSREYDRESKDLLALQSEIARQIAGGIDIELGDSTSPKPAAAPMTPDSYEAYDLYLRGLFFWNKRTMAGFRQAIYYFQQSVRKDPASARAYAALADSYTLESGYAGLPPGDLRQKARAAAQRAVELDPSSAEAHTAAALVAEDCDWDWKTAEDEYRRALKLSPNYATAHHWYGEYLSFVGRFDDAGAEFEEARQLDPLSLIVATDYGVTLYYERRFDDAIRQFRSVLDRDPSFPRAGIMELAYLEKGMKPDVLADLQKESTVVDESPWRWSNDAYMNGRLGRIEEARKDLRHLMQLNERQPADPIVFATAYLGLDENDLAVASLQKAFAEHSITLTSLNVNPLYDPLRSDPRFQDIVRKMNFTQ